MKKRVSLVNVVLTVAMTLSGLLVPFYSQVQAAVTSGNYTEDWQATGWRVVKVVSIDNDYQQIPANYWNQFYRIGNWPATPESDYLCLGPAQWQVDVNMGGKQFVEMWDGQGWENTPNPDSSFILDQGVGVNDQYRYDTFYVNDSDSAKAAIAKKCSEGRVDPVKFRRQYKYQYVWDFYMPTSVKNSSLSCLASLTPRYGYSDGQTLMMMASTYCLGVRFDNTADCQAYLDFYHSKEACEKVKIVFDVYNQQRVIADTIIHPAGQYGAFMTATAQYYLTYKNGVVELQEVGYSGGGVRGEFIYRGGMRSIPKSWLVTGRQK